MTNIIVVSFKQEEQAIAASLKLSELESYGDIIVHESVIIKKSREGKTEIIRTETTEGLRIISGMAIGTLLGAIAGPVGMIAGMFTGAITGAVLDNYHFGFSKEFGSTMISKMEPDTVSIIAEVSEPSPAFIDSALKPMGANLSRTEVVYEFEKYEEEQIEALDEEMDNARARIKTAAAGEKAKIQKKISDLKDKRRKKITLWEKKTKDALAHQKESHKDIRIERMRKRIEKLEEKLADLKHELEQYEFEHVEA